MVERWTTQLALRGLVLLDELEAIDVSDPVFAAYLDQVAIPVVEAQGARLLAGPVLAAMPDQPGTERVADDVVSFTPSPAESALIFAMNLAVLADRGEVPPQAALAADLAAIATVPATRSRSCGGWPAGLPSDGGIGRGRQRLASPGGPGVGTGRRRRLKSARSSGSMWVRIPPRAREM